MARIFLSQPELTALDEDLRRVLDQLADPPGAEPLRHECSVPLDVVETPDAVEILMDLPGVADDEVTVLFVRHTLVVTGRKAPGACGHRGAAFHLAERTFGRFARGVRLSGAFDAGRAEAVLRAGELRIVLPRIQDRRGQRLQIPVQAR